MAQTIITKYLGPTNTRGSRIKATCWNGTVTVSYDCGLESNDNHKNAANALIDHLESKADVNWKIIASGATPDDTGYAFIIQ